jgi:hypothetical protein
MMGFGFPDHWYLIHAADHPLELRYLDESRVSAEINGLIKAGVGAVGKVQAELKQLRAERAWQPIETAPRTADYILVWDPAYMTTRVVSWYDAPRVGPKIHPNDGYWGISMSDQECEPTHWQPLPAPPASESNRQAEPAGAETGSGG